MLQDKKVYFLSYLVEADKFWADSREYLALEDYVVQDFIFTVI